MGRVKKNKRNKYYAVQNRKIKYSGFYMFLVFLTNSFFPSSRFVSIKGF